MLEERWLFEAILETYLPLLQVFSRLRAEGRAIRVTMSMTPPLTAMLADDLLKERFVRYLERSLELARREVERTRWLPDWHSTACLYLARLTAARAMYLDEWQGDLVAAFRAWQEEGALELVTCCATHGYLPLMQPHPASVRAQIEAAVADHAARFGRPPRGIWLAECGYYPGLDQVLADSGLRFFFADAHGVLLAEPRPVCGVYAPMLCPSGVAAFARDPDSSRQVWSAEVGYPGDFEYREFYRDIGFDLDLEYLRPFLPATGDRVQTGFKYHRITDRSGGPKQPYEPAVALRKARMHADHFCAARGAQARELYPTLARPPLIVSPYDAELFGHWWFEGPDFLYYVLRRLADPAAPDGLAMMTPSDYLAVRPRLQVGSPCLSSWGQRGFHEVWLDKSNEWIYRHLHCAAERMTELADRFPRAVGLRRRALNQAARELLLLQASDWAFIMKTGTTVPYAEKRTRDHAFRFDRLFEDLKAGRIDEAWLREIEDRDTIFPSLDYRVYRSRSGDSPAKELRS
jgi:1,4-alpha-glucan branching enzyme